MARWSLVVLLIVAGMVVATPAAGVAQQSGVAASIRRGTCDGIGGVIAPLDTAAVPAGESRGVAEALPVARSFTTVPMSLAALAASEHAIAVPFPVGEELAGCGEIGGSLTDTGALVIGIAPQGDVAISGIAYLSPNPDPAQTDVSLFVTGEELFLLTAAFFPPTVAAEDAARFAAALAARDDSRSVAGPFAGQLVQREGMRAPWGAGITAEDFSATVTFVNPTEQTETPWDIGFAFHRTQDEAQIVTVDSGGTWTYSDPVTGKLAAGPLDTFDATPGATNTLDLVVEGTVALLGVNGVLATRIDLPPPTASDIFVGADWFPDSAVEGRTISFTGFEVWGGPGTTAPAVAPSAGSAEDDAALFATALAARDGASLVSGPFQGTIPQSMAGLAARPAGLLTLDFAATVTFVNPPQQAETPWDGGLAFHLDSQAATVQEVYFDSNGFWYYTDFPNGIQQSGIVPGFDAAPGGTNTLDLIVEGTTALFGINGEFVARLELPPPAPSDVMAATNFVVGNLVEGREIAYTDFAVWEAPDLAALPVTG